MIKLTNQSNLTIASSEGPVPTQETGTPTCLSMKRMQSMASLGRSSALVTFVMSFSQPFRVSQTTSTLANSSRFPGRLSIFFPLSLYSTPTLISLKASRMSSLVKLREAQPLTRWVYLIKGKSSHPHLRGRPVVVPNSWPLFLISSPVASTSSVGKGPSPTLVVQALATPMMVSILWGAIPSPVQTPPTDVEEEVTQGYVPRSMSKRVALAPSTSTLFPSLMWLLIHPTDSTIMLFLIRISANFFSSASSSGFSAWLQNEAILLYFPTKASQLVRSPTLRPYLWILAAQVGPIPFFVVPKFCLVSWAASSSSWYLVTRWARSERNILLAQDSLVLSSWLSSLNIPSRLTTTPLPSRFWVLGETMALGTKWKAYLTPFLTTVWPALAPPLKRAEMLYLSLSTETNFPLPSSPHCEPSTTARREFSPLMHLWTLMI